MTAKVSTGTFLNSVTYVTKAITKSMVMLVTKAAMITEVTIATKETLVTLVTKITSVKFVKKVGLCSSGMLCSHTCI